MAKLKRDFLGHYVECNGSINRPIVDRHAPIGSIIKVAHVKNTPHVKLTFEDGSTAQWESCGMTHIYNRAKKTLSEEKFHLFVLMDASYAVMSAGRAGALAYPEVAKLNPKGYLDYQSVEWQTHKSIIEKLKEGYSAEMAKKYVAVKPEDTKMPGAHAGKPLKMVPIKPFKFIMSS